MFVDPPADSGLPSRTKTWTEKGIEKTPVWGLVSEDILTLEGEVPDGCELTRLLERVSTLLLRCRRRCCCCNVGSVG